MFLIFKYLHIYAFVSYVRCNGNEMNSFWRCFHTIHVSERAKKMENIRKTRTHAKTICEHNYANRNSNYDKMRFERCVREQTNERTSVCLVDFFGGDLKNIKLILYTVFGNEK